MHSQTEIFFSGFIMYTSVKPHANSQTEKNTENMCVCVQQDHHMYSGVSVGKNDFICMFYLFQCLY